MLPNSVTLFSAGRRGQLCQGHPGIQQVGSKAIAMTFRWHSIMNCHLLKQILQSLLELNKSLCRPMKANDGSEVTLSSFLGNTPVVIFFYPKVVKCALQLLIFTPNCLSAVSKDFKRRGRSSANAEALQLNAQRKMEEVMSADSSK